MRSAKYIIIIVLLTTISGRATMSDIGKAEPKYIPDGSGFGLTYNKYSKGNIIINKPWPDYYYMNREELDQCDDECYDLTFSPNSKFMAYVARNYYYKENLNRYALKVLDINGHEIECRNVEGIKYGKPVFSPDSSRVAFLAENRKGDVNLWIMRVNGADIKRLANAAFVNPVFTTDGGNIIFVSSNENGGELSSINIDGTGKTSITDFHSPIEEIVLTPDGENLLIVAREFDKSYVLKKYNIYNMSVDGTRFSRLTDENTHDYAPVFFPDGKSIAYVSVRDGISDATYETPRYEKSKIYLMDVDGANKRRLTRSDLGEINPDISPDGKKVIYTECCHADVHRYHSIIQIKRDGTGRTESFRTGFADI